MDTYTRPSLTSCMMSIVPNTYIPDLSYAMLPNICQKYNISICVVRNHHYFQYGTNPTHIICDCVVEPMKDLSDYFKVYPLYALSHYSLSDLKNMATQLRIPLSKTRKQIYEDIQKEIQI